MGGKVCFDGKRMKRAYPVNAHTHHIQIPGHRPIRLRKCRKNTGQTVETVMERSHTPLRVWFWAAHLVASHCSDLC